MKPPLSAVEPFVFRGRNFFVKRDDMIDPFFSGNKFRKLYTFLATPAARYRRLVSFGGTQSNAMLSIAALCRQKGWLFDYYSKPLPGHLRTEPTGNLKKALSLGMNLLEVPHEAYRQTVAGLYDCDDEETLLIPQGGADRVAREGVAVLADEIRRWLAGRGRENISVATPSGTGTTAFFLAEALPEIRVMTTAVVGDTAYLKEQMRRLGPIPSNLTILESRKKHHFAKPYPELLKIYRELREKGMEFDLIYGAKMWHDLMELPRPEGEVILYIHSGGLIGNETMLERYRYKGLL
jgi:1-aminocyclopropane-1-carboxylate deaminase/D-cysteine desulfhydrase-like pyridoxal-dependent ACC family enzyme